MTVGAAPIGVSSRARRRALSRGWAWLLPALIFFLVFYLVPLAQMLWRSVSDRGFGLKHYDQIFASDVYIKVLFNTLKVGAIVSAICLVVGYPLAYFLARLSGRSAGGQSAGGDGRGGDEVAPIWSTVPVLLHLTLLCLIGRVAAVAD